MTSNWEFLMIFCFREKWVCLFSHIIIFQIPKNFRTRRNFCRMTRKFWKIANNSQKTLWFSHPTELSTVPEISTDLKNYSMRKLTHSAFSETKNHLKISSRSHFKTTWKNVNFEPKNVKFEPKIPSWVTLHGYCDENVRFFGRKTRLEGREVVGEANRPQKWKHLPQIVGS